MTAILARETNPSPEGLGKEPALLKAAKNGKARICAIFGGQGNNNLTAFSDLRDLIHRHGPNLRTLTENASATLSQLSSQPHKSGFYQDLGFHLQAWLDNPELAPSEDHLALSPISFPLNTLLSLAQYCITCQVFGKHPGQLRDLLHAVTGHSQGLLAAVVVSKADSWPSFYRACDQALRISFWTGLESHYTTPPCAVSAAAVADCVENKEGYPSSMLSVSGLSQDQLTLLLERTNRGLGNGNSVHLALVNSKEKFVIAGPPKSLRSLCVQFRQIKARDGLDQTRVLSHRRKPTVGVQFLPISSPYHSPYLIDVDASVRSHVPELALARDDLVIPVYHTHTAQNLQETQSNDLLRTIIRIITVDMVDWLQVIQTLSSTATTHVLDFGPGQIGNLVNEQTEGTGLRVIQVSDRSGSSGVSGRDELLSPTMPWAPLSWKDQFAPSLVVDEDSIAHLETKMTKVFGTPPVMVAGMTPTTAAWDFVATVMNSGYHIELAGGGYWDEQGFEHALRTLAAAIPPRRGISCNLLYANPKTISWQMSVLRRLAGDGVAIDGITIGAGIPSAEVVKEYIESIPGLRHISFKPGSVGAINEVIAIAQQYPEFCVGLQWTGGRAGGHHSWEDFYQPLLAMYGRIRRCPNIVFIIGSGLGCGDDTLPLLTGEWAHTFGYPSMPVDGILLGSRMMVAKEAHTSPQAKELIIRAQGVDDGEWHKSSDKPTGGVITVESEMGQPIHVLATRGMMLWKEFDQNIFSIKDKTKRLEYLHQHKAEIADRLSQDYFRPWFAVDSSGRNIELGDMTYLSVLRRLCQLMYVHRQNRWIDESYRTLVEEFIRLAHERFGRVSMGSTYFRPDDLLQQFEQTLAIGAFETLYPEDISLILALFRRQNQKPVPFIPQLDEHFITWFKKDSLWQSEDVDAVIDQDADRVCVIQGPVAVRHCTASDESAKDILDSICQAHVSMLLERGYKPTPMSLVTEPTTSMKPDLPAIAGVLSRADGVTCRVEVTKDFKILETERLIEHIINVAGSWAEMCLKDDWILRGTSRCRNPIKAAFRPVAHDTIEIRRVAEGSFFNEIVLIPGSSTAENSRTTLKITHNGKGPIIVTIILPRSTATKRLTEIEFPLEVYQGPKGCRLYEDPSTHAESVRSLYHQLWINDSFPNAAQVTGLSSEFNGNEIVLCKQSIYDYINVVRRSSGAQLRSWSPSGLIVPLDYCIVVAWTALTKPLMIPGLNCNLLQLLHRSICFRYAPSARPLQIGDTVKTFSRITALTIVATGKLVKVSADIRRQGERVVTIETEFFLRGNQGGTEEQFSSVNESEVVVHVDSPVKNALLISRKWLIFDEQPPDLIGKRLRFGLTTHTMYDNENGNALLQVSGTVTLAEQSDTSTPIQVGRVYFEEESCLGNPVMDFLRRHGAPLIARQQLENPGWMGVPPIIVHAPANSAPYAAVSHDTNPIHVCPLFAQYAGLPGTVVHGMHTSAIVRRAVEWAMGDTDRTRFKGWQASFEAMVRPKDRLRVEIQHVAVDDGRMVLNIQTFNDETGERMLDAEAEVEQPRTGYVFCGQGSQEKGMGMSLCSTRPEVKALWDRAEAYLRMHYGFSLRHIVQENPKTLTVHFGGNRGRHIRNMYLAMTRRVSTPGGGSREEPILRSLTLRSKSYTFSHPTGLLMSTQFSQPALVVMEMAEYVHLQARGVAQTGARFAGHSLGEYAALGACTSFMPFECLLSLIYYRGLKMQNALPRDAHGRTDYTMVAADPSRINPDFGEDHLQTLVQVIAEETGLLLETVNYNIRSQQYVCAGHFQPLWILGKVCDGLSTKSHPERLDITTLRDMARGLIPRAQLFSNSDPLTRGKATIPLTGIDIPFHSRALRSQIDDYREYLSRSIHVADIKPEELVGRWIPNVVGRPFSLKREYIEMVQRVTGSEVLLKLLAQIKI
ncbi:acyl transferase domain-containing protein [Triangularia setosa]|uniref:Acyl transferase domain-containing protein n=1 Tax=Triangularia setosa TaxID=2587417 RepID=A0AAN6W8B5_9PEZI|nr:acyl transferase domain-containing protein [Podospora setosa]